VSRVRLLFKYLAVYALFISGALRYARRAAARRNAVAILTFHRVLDDNEFKTTSSLPGIVVRAGTFAALCRYLHRHCTPVDACGITGLTGCTDRPRTAVTFDDGWSDNGIIAANLLHAFSIPATIFICPGLMGRIFPFWPEQAVAARSAHYDQPPDANGGFIESLKARLPAEREAILATLPPVDEAALASREPLNATLSWADVPPLLARAFSVGSHTYSHQILTQLPLEQMRDELELSRTAIEAQLGQPCTSFAYPNGNHSAGVQEAVRKAGYDLAFTTDEGLWTAGCSPLAIPRVNISEARITGPFGGFSRAMFEYYVFWRPSIRSNS
jgi:peptidoglycan/xylan/chitin deacetylase (PgdA/CDA1 family)